MARKRLTVEGWISQALTDSDKGAPCSALSLVYVKGSGVGVEEIHTKPLDGSTQDAAQLGQFFVSRATTFAQDLPGIQTFRMLAFYGKKEEPQAAFPFTTVDGELTGGLDVPYSKHEPTPTGLLGQLMKHNEAQMMLCVQLCQSFAMGALERESALRRENAEALMIAKDAIFTAKKETHDMRMAELAFARSTGEREMMAKALPGILNQLTGREIVPEGTADTHLIDALAMKIKPEQIQQLIALGFVPPDVGALLAGRFEKALLKKKAEVQAMRTLPGEGDEDKG